MNHHWYWHSLRVVPWLQNLHSIIDITNRRWTRADSQTKREVRDIFE